LEKLEKAVHAETDGAAAPQYCLIIDAATSAPATLNTAEATAALRQTTMQPTRKHDSWQHQQLQP
jgi:hypothetical protein